MKLLSTAIEEYVEAHSLPESPLLKELRRETHLKVLSPNMLSGPIQGSLLAMLVRLIQPQRILEIGTFTGYSALWMAAAMPQGGKLITLDKNEELAGMVRHYIQQAGLQEVIQPMLGDAVALIPTLKETFDLVFIDADKINYPRYYELVFDKVRPGGLIVADNVLWHGKVVPAPDDKIDAKTQVIMDFNDQIQQDSRVENVLLPVRDGLMIVRKR
jgi:caffeoyl-CoA O-methyltransferase